MAKQVLIGTSGWSYQHWYDLFYPQDIRSDQLLEYYAQTFSTVEINNTFYQLPRASSVSNWFTRTPNDFIFAVKGSRYLTHIKKLRDSSKGLNNYFSLIDKLKDKLGPILFQLPPNFPANQERLKSFTDQLPQKNKYAFEFRHQSWFSQKTYDILQGKDIALCLVNPDKYNSTEKITADFIYCRLHGSTVNQGNYRERELDKLAEKVKKWQNKVNQVFIYFNNDLQGFAVQNARYLKDKINNG